MVIFIVWIIFIPLEQKINLSLTKKYVKSIVQQQKKYSSTTKIGEHILCGYSMWTIWGFNHIEDKHALHRGKDCMKRIWESLIERAKSIIDFEKKKCYH